MNLPCGCSRTATYLRSICPDAERLWDRVADAHKALAKAIRENRPTREFGRVQAQRAYDEALAAYEKHTAAVEAPEVVERPLL